MTGFRERCQPSLTTLLIDHPTFAPARVSVVKALIGGSHCNFVRVLRLGIEAIEILHCHRIIGSGGFGGDPGITTITVRVAECAGVAKEEQRVETQRASYTAPVDGKFLQPEKENGGPV